MTEQRILRGDIYFSDLSPTIGSEQGGIRPVLVLQNNVGNIYSPTVIVAAITSKTKRILPTHISIGESLGLKQDSVVLLEQLRTIDRSRLRDYIGAVDSITMKQIDTALLISIGLKDKEVGYHGR